MIFLDLVWELIDEFELANVRELKQLVAAAGAPNMDWLIWKW